MAYYKTITGYKPVHIYQAIKMKNSLIKNRDENLEFYDIPNDTVAERLSPVRTSKDGKAAHFSYYPNSKRSSSGSEKTMTHRMYEIVTKNLILSRNNQELENKIKQLETDLFEERNKSLLKKLFGHFFAARKA